MRKIIPVVKPSMPPKSKYVKNLKDIWESRWLTNSGPKHQLLEKKLINYLGVSNIELFANGHLALELALIALNLEGEIITTPFTYASTTQAIVRNGLTPVFCDIRESDYTMDVSKIEALITEKTSAILAVHVYGNLCDVEGIQRIADKYNLKVIYDAAHSFGIKFNDQFVGNFGDMTMFSFHATKVFHTFEGGAITFRDIKYKEIFAQLKQFGMKDKENVVRIGTNAKMTEAHAAMGLCNLEYIDKFIFKRSKITNRYLFNLKGIKGLKFNIQDPRIISNFSYFPVFIEKENFGINRDELLKVLEKNNIFARRYFYPLTSNFDTYLRMFKIHETPIANNVSNNIITLPLYPDLKLRDVDYICKILKEKVML